MRILSVVGARPNFMKVAPIMKALDRHPARFEQFLVHTGQHYDEKMSDSFFEALRMPTPDVNLGVGSGSHAEQTGKVMVEIEPVLKSFRPDLVIVVGDVNSTLACALTAKKLQMRVAHVEAGLRSGDMSMPEEINRLCTDAICDDLFVTDRLAVDNLRREGAAEARIHLVGNVMIDSLLSHLNVASRLDAPAQFGVTPGAYATMTLHRPSNVEDPSILAGIIEAVRTAAPDLPVVFPVHPRTRQRITDFGLLRHFTEEAGGAGIRMVEPLGYLEFLGLNRSARLVLTDSGGLQEETTILGVPCVTIRENTERPITITEGTNRLAGVTPAGVRAAIADALAAGAAGARRPELWDGKAADRIADVIASL